MKNRLTILFLLVLPLIGFSQINDSNIQDAVNLWVSNQSAAESTYGNISEWDVSNVTDMYQLFKNKQNLEKLKMKYLMYLTNCLKLKKTW